MKLIHLSDLHLGKRVNEFSMLEDQAYILMKILNVIDDEQPDAVLIAGDRIVSKLYTLAAFLNLIAILLLCYTVMRLKARL